MKDKIMKIIFFGSDDFATTNLKRLIESHHDVVATVTQPDKAQGRGLRIGMRPVKELSGKHNIPVIQPRVLKEKYFIEELKTYQADLFVVIAYGKILPTELLKIPKKCAINVHASLLPRYRGAAPVNWAIINGEEETGISVIKLNEHMDAGDIILQQKVTIENNDTSITLRAKLAKFGTDCLCEAIDMLEKNTCSLIKQDETKVTYAPKLTKAHGLILWEKSAQQIHNMVRGLLPWPSAYTHYDGKLLKVLETDVGLSGPSDSKPGTIVDISKEGFVVATGNDRLLVKKVHLESSKPMDVKDFMAGHKISLDHRFS